MNALTVAVPSPIQPQRPLDCALESFAPESSSHESFASRAAEVNRLIDKKADLVLESARLQALSESNPELREQCHSLIQTLEENINHLQGQIDREIEGLFYSLQKAPAPSPYLDDLPG